MIGYNVNYIIIVIFMKNTYNFVKMTFTLYFYKLYGNYKHIILNKLDFIYITIFSVKIM